MSEFDARLDRDSAILRRAQSFPANSPSFVLLFGLYFVGWLVPAGVGTLLASGMVGWGLFAAIVVGTALVTLTPFGNNLPIALCVFGSIAIMIVSVFVAALPGYVTLGVVLLGAVLVLATPNGGNFMLMGMAVISLFAGLVTIWAAALAIFGADT